MSLVELFKIYPLFKVDSTINRILSHILVFIITAQCVTASTIKCPTNLKPILKEYTNEVYIEILKKMNTKATKIVNRIAAMEKRKTIPDSLFYILWITAILLFLFFIMVSYLNYAFFHVDKLWNLIFVFCFLISFAIGVTIYLCRRDSE